MAHQFMLQLALWGAGQAGVGPLHRPLPKAPGSSLGLLDTRKPLTAEPSWANVGLSQPNSKMGVITPIRNGDGKPKSNHIPSVVGPWSALHHQSTSGRHCSSHPAGTSLTWPAASHPVLLGSLLPVLPASTFQACSPRSSQGNYLRTSQISAQVCSTRSSGPSVQPKPLQTSATC